MPTQLPGGIVRLDVNDPQDLQVLIDRGLIWRSGPKDLQTAMRAIQNGEVKRAPDKEPPEVRAYLDKVAPVEELPGQPEEAEPAEEPNEAPEPGEVAEPPEPESPAEDMAEPGEEAPLAPPA